MFALQPGINQILTNPEYRLPLEHVRVATTHMGVMIYLEEALPLEHVRVATQRHYQKPTPLQELPLEHVRVATHLYCPIKFRAESVTA